MSYAANTSVSPEKSQAEIQQVLRRYGADKFGVMEDREKAYVMFVFKGLRIQMDVALPNKGDKKYMRTATGRPRMDGGQRGPMRWRTVRPSACLLGKGFG